MTNQFTPTSLHTFCTSTNRTTAGLSTVADLCPNPNNSLVGLLTAAYSLPLISADRPRVEPLQPSQIVAIVDDLLRELEEDLVEENAIFPLETQQ